MILNFADYGVRYIKFKLPEGTFKNNCRSLFKVDTVPMKRNSDAQSVYSWQFNGNWLKRGGIIKVWQEHKH